MCKVFVAEGMYSAASWINDNKIASSVDEADLVLFTGGSDISPSLYNAKPNPKTSSYRDRDTREVNVFMKAVSLNKPMFGICRGLQLIGALSGAKLIQDLSHPSTHLLEFYDGSSITTNSAHHQMVYPYDMDRRDYRILGWAQSLSKIYSGETYGDMDIKIFDTKGFRKEPEVIYFPKTRGIGFQGHPEWLQLDSSMVTYANILIKALIDNKLSYYLDKNYSMDDLGNMYGVKSQKV